MALFKHKLHLTEMIQSHTIVYFGMGGIIISAVSTLIKIGSFWSGLSKNKSIDYSEAALKVTLEF